MRWADSFAPIGMPPAVAADLGRDRPVVGGGAQIGERRRRHGGRALGQPPDLGDATDDLGAGQMATGAGLGTLAELEVERLHVADLLERPSEAGRRELVEVAAVLGVLLGEHPALARADAGAGTLGAPGERHLRLERQGTEAHVRHEQRDVEAQRPVGAGPDRDVGAHRFVVEQRSGRELGRDDLDRVPAREPVAWHPHRGHRPVMAELRQPVGRQLADLADERLLGRTVRILVGAQVRLAVVGLWVLAFPGGDLVGVHQHVTGDVVDPRAEAVELLVVVVHAHAGAHRVVPAVEAADQVVAAHGRVGHERAAVQATAVEHRVVVAETDDHEVDARDEGPGRGAIGEVGPACDRDRCHVGPPSCAPRASRP